MSDKIPMYRLHRTSGRAVVTLNGKFFYLGAHNSPESRQEYNRLIAKWLEAGKSIETMQGKADALEARALVGEVWEAYCRHVEKHYCRADGTATSEQTCIRSAIRPLYRLFGDTAAADFGPLNLKTVREEMVRLGWCRRTINAGIKRIVRMFKWATEEEMIPGNVSHALEAVASLRAGRSTARESEPVRPVPDAYVDAIEGHVSAPVWAMVQLQRITGMRSGEVVVMRTGDIQMKDDVWVYKPRHHKTAHHGHGREVWIGPKAQEIIRPYLRTDLEAFIFSPAEAEETRNAQRRAERKTLMTPSQAARMPATVRARAPRARYDVNSYRRAIARGCSKAFGFPTDLAAAAAAARSWRKEFAEKQGRRPTAAELPEKLREAAGAVAVWKRDHQWHPRRLRHNAATDLRARYGIEIARTILGHRSAGITEIYAEVDTATARRIMREVG